MISMQKLDLREPCIPHSLNILSTDMVQTVKPYTCYQYLSSHECMERPTKLKRNLIKIRTLHLSFTGLTNHSLGKKHPISQSSKRKMVIRYNL